MQIKPFNRVNSKKSFVLAVFFCVLFLSRGVYAEKQSQPDVLLVVGDSLSAAYNLAEEQGWVSLLEQKLNKHPNFKHSYRVVNASVGGATSAAALQRLPSLLKAYSPRVVILEMGANDGLQGKPVPYITNNLSQLIDLCLERKAKVVLIGIRIPPNYGKRYTEPFFNQYAELAHKYQLSLVPFLLEGVAGDSQLMQQDRLHPTAEAQSLALDNVWVILKDVL